MARAGPSRTPTGPPSRGSGIVGQAGGRTNLLARPGHLTGPLVARAAGAVVGSPRATARAERAVTSPKREFAEHLEALRARLGREHRALTPSDWQELRDRHDAWTRWALDDTPNPPGLVQVKARPTPWELIEVEFGPEPLPEPEPTTAPVKRKRARAGKSYSADVAATVVRRVLSEQPSRACATRCTESCRPRQRRSSSTSSRRWAAGGCPPRAASGGCEPRTGSTTTAPSPATSSQNGSRRSTRLNLRGTRDPSKRPASPAVEPNPPAGSAALRRFIGLPNLRGEGVRR